MWTSMDAEPAGDLHAAVVIRIDMDGHRTGEDAKPVNKQKNGLAGRKTGARQLGARTGRVGGKIDRFGLRFSRFLLAFDSSPIPEPSIASSGKLSLG